MKTLFAPSATTCEAPSAWLGKEWGGRDDFGLRDWTFSGAGLDAPQLIARGSVSNRNYDEVPASTYVQRPGV